MTYFNTNRLEGAELAEAERDTRRQESVVLAFFRARPGQPFTPDQVWANAFTAATPLTSIRRAITVLTNRGVLVKTERMRQGRYGKPAHCWKYEPERPQQPRLL